MWLLLACLLLHVPTPSSAAPSLQLPIFTLAQLQAADAATLKRAGEAMERYGVFAVTGLQGSASTSELAGQALQGFVSCADRGLLNGNLKQVTLEDGTLRRTLATTTDANTPQPLPGAIVHSCPQFAQAASGLRAAVASVGEAYSSVLDKLMYGDAACRTPAECFTSAVREGESLEHFHVFKSSPGHTATGAETDPSSMLSMHSDIGLFLVMTPAQYFAAGGDKQAFAVSGSSAHDLRVALPKGEVVEPLFPADCVLVMNGEGLSRWMRPSAPGRVHPWSPMHEVLSQHMGNSVRAWFGRMYFPAHHAVLSDGSDSSHSLTFKEYRQQTYTAFREGKGATASTLGCTPSRRLLVDEGSCGANQIYCWMSCMAIPSSLTCSPSQITCQNINTGKLWPQDYLIPGTQEANHCFDCALTCPANTSSNSTVPISTSTFCNTRLQPTTMWMTGFQFAANHESSPCVIFLFPEWVLDSAVKFGFACLGAFTMGLFVGCLTRLRLSLQRRWMVEGVRDFEFVHDETLLLCIEHGVLILIIATTICLGYFLMLVAMTYQAELFIMVILGLAFGHLFNMPRYLRRQNSVCKPMLDDPPLEPCCAA